jgi:hypothetical protein
MHDFRSNHLMSTQLGTPVYKAVSYCVWIGSARGLHRSEGVTESGFVIRNGKRLFALPFGRGTPEPELAVGTPDLFGFAFADEQSITETYAVQTEL